MGLLLKLTPPPLCNLSNDTSLPHRCTNDQYAMLQYEGTKNLKERMLALCQNGYGRRVANTFLFEGGEGGKFQAAAPSLAPATAPGKPPWFPSPGIFPAGAADTTPKH